MYRSSFLLPLLSAVVFITACAHEAPAFVPAPEQAEKGSIVYIYRPSSSSNFMMSPQLVIDDQARFRVGNGDYHYVYLQAGEHALRLQPTDQYSAGQAVALVVETGRSHYLRVGTLLQFEPEGMNTREFWIEVVDEPTALRELARTGYAGLSRQAETEAQPSAGPGFSVDKTQDPFAGKQR